MTAQSGPRTAVVDVSARRAGDHRQPPAVERQPRKRELADPDSDSDTCFDHCSPIRTRCPGPAARLSVTGEGRWTPICRRG